MSNNNMKFQDRLIKVEKKFPEITKIKNMPISQKLFFETQIKTEYKEETALVWHVDPFLAYQILKLTKKNRNPLSKNIDYLKNKMQKKQFLCNGDSIRIDKNMNLIDGSNRLFAIIESGETIKTFFALGLEPDVQKTIDIGAKRHLYGFLEIEGVEHAKAMAIVVKFIIFHFNNLSSRLDLSTEWFDHELGLSTYKKHEKELKACYKLCNNKSALILAPISHVTYIAFLLLSLDKKDQFRTKFLSKVIYGYNISEHCPTAIFRNSFLVLPKGYVKRRLFLIEIIKAWNCYIDDKKYKFSGKLVYEEPRAVK